MGIIKAFKLGFDYLKYDEDGNVEATQRAVYVIINVNLAKCKNLQHFSPRILSPPSLG